MKEHIPKNNRKKTKKVKCWDVFQCDEKDCPAYKSKNLKCWLFSGTHCHQKVQGKFLEKIELCLDCEVFPVNLDISAARDSFGLVSNQLKEYRSIVEQRDKELEEMSMELAIGLSEVFEALKKISAGDPDVRVAEISNIELISKLKHLVNLTAEEIGEIVNQSHEFAIALAEHFDVLHRVSQGILSARIHWDSEIELLESLKSVTNSMIESISREIGEREVAESALQKAYDELESRVKERTAELLLTNERLSQEIAERNKVEEALRKSEQKYRTVFEHTGNPTLLVEGDTTISMVNTKFEEFSGYSKEEVEGKMSWKSFFEKPEIGRLSEYHHMRRITPNIAPMNYETRFVDRRGNVRNVLVNVAMIPGSRKSVESLLDVTDRKKLEEKMYQADKLSSIGTLAAGVAHEINNPLAIILGFTDLLLEKVPAGSDMQDMLMTVQKQGENAKRIVENLLSFVRFKEHRDEDVDINKSIQTVLAIEGNTLMLNNIDVEMNLAEYLPMVKGDTGELQQVFFNVINNAVCVMKAGGVLTISTRVDADGHNVELLISDTGHGIRPEHRKKIFDPLFTTKKVGEGTGLGLTVSYAIIKKHGGLISFETRTSEESDRPGTTFIISLPAIVLQKSPAI